MLDLLIIGAGGAGLTAALTAHKAGLSVTVATKTLPTQAQTCMAQGGINAALGNIEPDSIDAHIEDTLKSAHGLANEIMVRRMCKEAPKSVAWLDSIGVPFSRIDNARSSLESIYQRRLGGAGSSRACCAQDYTGLKILHTLYDQCLKANITFAGEHYLLNLITNRGLTSDDLLRSNAPQGYFFAGQSSAGLTLNYVHGATFWDSTKGEVTSIPARKVLLATGGYGTLYHGYNTNSYGTSGDGIAAVLRAGGTISDMEFVQFHPTSLRGSSILISESARGAGGYLIDDHGKRFTDELAHRDEVARAIYRQVQQGHTVSLDIRHLGAEKIEELMPQELHLIRLHAKLDPITQPIPIMPTAHHTMGGIDVNEQFQVTGLANCYAIGECSNAKVHGANRLGGNALLEIVAFGRLAIESITESGDSTPDPSAEMAQVKHDRGMIEKIFAKPNEINFYHKRKVLGKLLYRDAGILRHHDRMHEAVTYLKEIQEKLTVMGVGDKAKVHNQNLIEFLEFRNELLLAEALLKSAEARKESRGAHYREDFPIERAEYTKHTYCKLSKGEITIES